MHLSNWAKITTDPWVLETAAGYKLEFMDTPVQSHPPITVVNRDIADKISTEVETMLEKGAIFPIRDHLSQGFYSRIFLVPKKDGQSRPVINLHPLNQHLPYQHFKMEGIHVVRDLLQEGDWMSRIDLKDVYFAIPIHKEYRQYLRFLWQDQAYKFTCLPFGLSTALRVFTKLLRPIVGFLRSHGIRCVIYLDDILIMHQDKATAVEHTATAVSLLKALGFLINYPKSQLEPSQIIDFLGFVVDSLKRELRLPQAKLTQIRQEVNSLLKREHASARNLAQLLLGKMSAAILAIHPAPLHYRELQNLKHKAMRTKG